MRGLYCTLFLLSCSILMFEVSLTRIFSIYLWYHFAFMVISIAMLGFGCSGTFLSLFFAGKGQHDVNASSLHSPLSRFSSFLHSDSSIAIWAALTGISILGCYILSNAIPFDPVKFSWENRQILYLALYCFVLSVPFFFSGLLIATFFFIHSKKSMAIYSSDLIGAGTGSLAVLVLLNAGGPEYAILAASSLSLAGSLITGNRYVRIISFFFLAMNALAAILHPALLDVQISPYKNLSLALKYPGSELLKTYHSAYARIDTFRSPAVRFAPGLSLKYLESLPDQTGLSIDGSSINAITEATDKSKLGFLRYLPSSAVYELKDRGDVLVLDPKGGLQVLMAKQYRASRVHHVESNPMIAKIIQSDFDDFSGNIFAINSRTGYGRNYLHGLKSTDKDSGIPPALKKHAPQEFAEGIYDVIDIPMTDTSVSGTFGISEDYRYTVEAFIHYLGALKKDGILSISTYLIPPPRTEFRVLATIVSALDEMHIAEPVQRIIALRSWDSMAILVKKTPFTLHEVTQIRYFCEDRRFDIVLYPGIKEGESNKYIQLPSDEYFAGFRKILSETGRTSFLKNYLFDVEPVYDDNPFFHYYLKLDTIHLIYQKMGRKLMFFLEEGYLLPCIFIIILLLSAVLILFPVVFKAVKKSGSSRFSLTTSYPVLIYFAMLGLGFMFVEVSLIQRSILLLENPSYAFAVILTVLLVSSGSGSMLSTKFSTLKSPYILLILSCLILSYSLIYPLLLSLTSTYSMIIKIAVLIFLLIPLGLFMGIPFPLGIQILGQKNETMIPWAWAINAFMSVLAPLLTIMIALVLGFTVTFWTGAAAYALAFGFLKKLMKS